MKSHSRSQVRNRVRIRTQVCISANLGLLVLYYAVSHSQSRDSFIHSLIFPFGMKFLLQRPLPPCKAMGLLCDMFRLG